MRQHTHNHTHPSICTSLLLFVVAFVDTCMHSSTPEDQMAVRTAEKLLKEVCPQSSQAEQKVRVLENYILLATKSKLNIEKALERFMDMASSEVGFI